MKFEIELHPSKASDGLALSSLVADDGRRLCVLDIQYSQLADLGNALGVSHELVLIASGVYCMDKLVQRSSAADAWTRDMCLTVPVEDPAVWKSAAAELSRCISFLTGDYWSFSFVRRKSPLVRPAKKSRRRRQALPAPRTDTVSLFSGGLDSLVGVIDWLEQNPKRNLSLVGHHESQMAGPYADQRALRDGLANAYPHRTRPVLVRVGHTAETGQADITLRGRSFVFIALGIFTASALGRQVPLLIPENGTIALNVPLTPSRRGSCSTRTAHPYYLASLQRVLNRVGITNPLLNPLATKTKGEAVQQCLNRKLLQQIASDSVSCAKRGHRVHWTRRSARSCGRCMPCIYRRAALHSVGWDDEVYGDDICTGEIDLDDAGEKATDLRACYSFLNRHPSSEEITKMLLANGSLEPTALQSGASIIGRAMDEIRQLLRDKATPEMKRRAGLGGKTNA